MADLGGLGRLFIVLGVALIVVGAALVLGWRLPSWGRLGRLPGDLILRRGPITVYVPILTSLILSLLLTIILRVIARR